MCAGIQAGEGIHKVPSCAAKLTPNTAGCPGVGPAVEQLGEFAFKTQLLDQNAHLCKKKGGGRRFWGNGCEILRAQARTDKSVQIKAGIFQWALGNWASGERQREQRAGGGTAVWPLGGHGREGSSCSDRRTPVEGTPCPLCSWHRARFSLGTSQRCHLTQDFGSSESRMVTWRGLIAIKGQVLHKGQKMIESLEAETAVSDVSPQTANPALPWLRGNIPVTEQ